MNWTGGRLQRHSRNTTNAVAAKQKQHFARVRARLQNGECPRTSPFQPNFLPHEDPILSVGLIPLGQDSHCHAGHARNRQHPLEEYDTTAPLVPRLSLLKTQSREPHDVNRGSSRSKNELLLNRRLYHSRKKRSRGSISSSKVTSRGGSGDLRQETIRNEDLLTEDAVLETNRKRLLQQEDWVGLEASLPLMIEFGSRQPGIAKRRKVDCESRNRKAHLRDLGNVPPVMDTNYQHKASMRGTIRNKPESIDIRIGSAALRSQAATAAPPLTPSALESSDHMLFDESIEVQLQNLPQDPGPTIPNRENASTEKHLPNAAEEPGVPELLNSVSVHLSGGSEPSQRKRVLELGSSGMQVAEMLDLSNNNEKAVAQSESTSNSAYDVEHPNYPGYHPCKIAEQIRGDESKLNGNQSPRSSDKQFSLSPKVNENLDHRFESMNTSNSLIFATSPLLLSKAAYNFEGPVTKVGSPAHQWVHPSAETDLQTPQPIQVDAVMQEVPGFTRLLSLCSSESKGLNADDLHGKLPEQLRIAEAALAARMLPQSQTATIGSSLTVTAAGIVREVESAVRGLQSPSASLRNIRSLEQRPLVESDKAKEKAVSEEMWKRFVFGSTGDNSSQPNEQDAPLKRNCLGQELHSSSMSVQVGTVEPGLSIVQPGKSPRHEYPGSSLFVQGTTTSPETKVTRTGSEGWDRTSAADKGRRLNEVDEENLENHPLLSKHEANIHAGTASLQRTNMGGKKALSWSCDSMYHDEPMSQVTGKCSDAALLAHSKSGPKTSRSAHPNMLPSETGATIGQNDSSSAAQSEVAQPPQRRIIFTKPPRFHGASGAVREQGPTHIGRIHAGKTRKGRSGEEEKAKSATEKQSPFVYVFPGSPSDEEIEDY